MAIFTRGNIWDYHNKGCYAVIPTNIQTKQNGEAVMGAGLAKQAANKFPNLPLDYGCILRQDNSDSRARKAINIGMLVFTEYKLIMLATKFNWKEKSNLMLISGGLIALQDYFDSKPEEKCAVPRIGCGLGGFNWEDEVKPIVEKILTSEQFIVLEG